MNSRLVDLDDFLTYPRAATEQNREQNRIIFVLVLWESIHVWGINSRISDLDFFFLGMNSRLMDLEDFWGVRRDPDSIISNRRVPSVPTAPSVPSELVKF